jgi:2-polyprenyl-6-hydroxyphenyl methylase/3-demethylubiquinone-9 3-methyltransferase
VRARPFHTWKHYAEHGARGMSAWQDVIDWVGGLPFEVAKPEQILLFLRPRGFELINLETVAGKLGCNQFVFERRHVES